MIEAWLGERQIRAVVFDLGTFANGGACHDGALGTLETFRGTGVKMGLVTLESSWWANHTLDHLGVREYFDYIGTVNGVNPFYGRIGSRDWGKAFAVLGVLPEKGIVVGSVLPGDIWEIGVKYRVRVLSEREMFDAKRRHERTINVESISHVVTALLATV